MHTNMYLRGKKTLEMTQDHIISYYHKFSLRAHAQLSYTNICTYHMEGTTATLLYIYGNCLILESIRVDERELSHMV